MNVRETHKLLDGHYSSKGEIEDSHLVPWQYMTDNMSIYSATFKDGTKISVKLHRSYPEDNTHYEI